MVQSVFIVKDTCYKWVFEKIPFDNQKNYIIQDLFTDSRNNY